MRRLVICVLLIAVSACGKPPTPDTSSARTGQPDLRHPTKTKKPPLFLGGWSGNPKDPKKEIYFGKTFFMALNENLDDASVGAWKETGDGVLEIKLTTGEVFALQWEIDGNYLLLTQDGKTRRLRAQPKGQNATFRAVGRAVGNNKGETLTARSIARGWRSQRAKYEKMDGASVDVTGQVGSVRKQGDRHILTFMDEECDILADLTCELEKDEQADIARMKKGDHVTLCGTARIRDGQFVLAACWVVENEGRNPPKEESTVSLGK
jgi:hypothetical protein